MARKKTPARSGADAPLPAFEQSLARVREIVEAIESGEATLEQSLERYGEGVKLIAHCRAILDRAEQKINELTAGETDTADEGGDG